MSAVERLGRHRPVMLEAVVEALRLRPGGRYVDATIGEGGIAERLLVGSCPNGEVLGLDWDGDALVFSAKRLVRFGDRLRLVRDSYANLEQALYRNGWRTGADGVVLDLGLSTLQLGQPDRGFSFSACGPLDMRMDRRCRATAADLLNKLSEKEIAALLRRYGEERACRRVARQIVLRRRDKPLRTTAELRAVVQQAGVRGRPGHDPATRTFQALRIAVNGELEELERFLAGGWKTLKPGGRLAVLSYHSLEDRLVKQAFRKWAASCICPPRQPVCRCGWRPRVTLVTKRRRPPSQEEVTKNPRARSAGLRVVERLL